MRNTGMTREREQTEKHCRNFPSREYIAVSCNLQSLDWQQAGLEAKICLQGHTEFLASLYKSF